MSEEFRYYDETAENPDVRTIMTDFREQVGFIPNILAAMAESPEALKAYMDMAELLTQGELTGEERHVVWLAASYENQCPYDMAIHSAYAQKVRRDRLPDEQINKLRRGEELTDAKLQALGAFTRKLVAENGDVARDDVESLLAAGYTRRTVFEVILAVGMKTLTNHASRVLETPLDDFARGHEWRMPENDS